MSTDQYIECFCVCMGGGRLCSVTVLRLCECVVGEVLGDRECMLLCEMYLTVCVYTCCVCG